MMYIPLLDTLQSLLNNEAVLAEVFMHTRQVLECVY